MAHKKVKSIEDLESVGFKVYDNRPVDKGAKDKPAEKQVPAKIIIMDNNDVLKAVQESNAALKTGLETLVNSMYSMQEKPDNFTLTIERDQRGLMKSINVKVNK
jgi:hypothetical protein